MHAFFTTFPRKFARCFSPAILPWHLAAIAISAVSVLSGFDGAWFRFMAPVRMALFSAAVIGGLLPIVLPIALLLFGAATRSARTARIAWTIAQAELIGMLLSFFYKAFTGRAHPDLSGGTADISRVFHFGILKGGVFWGWPSSHTTVSFALAGVLWALFPKNRLLKAAALLYAFFIGIGVSVSIHWFSDFAAGAIFGWIAGRVAGADASLQQKSV